MPQRAPGSRAEITLTCKRICIPSHLRISHQSRSSAAGKEPWWIEAAQIAGLIEQCRWEIEGLTVTREVLSGLVTISVEAVSVDPKPAPGGVFVDQLRTILAEAGRTVRCREVVAVMGEDPGVARHGERVRHRLKKLVTAGRVIEVEPGTVHSHE